MIPGETGSTHPYEGGKKKKGNPIPKPPPPGLARPRNLPPLGGEGGAKPSGNRSNNKDLRGKKNPDPTNPSKTHWCRGGEELSTNRPFPTQGPLMGGRTPTRKSRIQTNGLFKKVKPNSRGKKAT